MAGEEQEERYRKPLISADLAEIREKKLDDIPVSAIMRKNVITIDSNDTVKKAAQTMSRNKIGSVIVMENGSRKVNKKGKRAGKKKGKIIEKKRAVGIITERDIVRKVVSKGKSINSKVKTIMSTPIKVIKEGKSIKDTISLMNKYKIKRLPIVDAEKRLIGIVTDADISRAIPGIIDLMAEISNIKRFEATTESVGICNKCGLYSDTLMNVGGEFLCAECRREERSR